MKKALLLTILSISVLITFGQNTSDSILIKKQMGTVFIQNGKKLTTAQMPAITKANPTFMFYRKWYWHSNEFLK